MTLAIGSAAPDFTLFDQNREPVSLSDLKGTNALIVFIPFPFTGICDSEGCMLRDGLADLADLDAQAVVITAHAVPVTAKWAMENRFEFSVLSDYWPHGDVIKAYGAFNEKLGSANRVTYVLDGEGIIRDIIASDALGTPREQDLYGEALAAI